MFIAVLSNIIRLCTVFSGRMKAKRKSTMIYDIFFFMIWFNFNVALTITGNVVVWSSHAETCKYDSPMALKVYKTAYSIVIWGYPTFALWGFIVIFITLSCYISSKVKNKGFDAVAGPNTCIGKCSILRNVATKTTVRLNPNDYKSCKICNKDF